MNRLASAIALLVIPTLLTAQAAATADGAVRSAINSISETDVYNRIGVIAHDSMRGRDTPSPGLEMTANYIADQFRTFGLQPLGDNGSYLQRFPLVRSSWDREGSTVTAAPDLELRLGDTFQLLGSAGAGAGPEELTGEVTGPAVVVAGRLTRIEQLADVDLAGAIVFAIAPTWNGEFTPAFAPLAGALARRSPAAVIIVSNRSGVNFRQAATNLDRTSLQKGWEQRGAASGILFLEVLDQAVARFFRHHGFDLAEARANLHLPITSTRLSDTEVTVTLRRRSVESTAPNVVGLLEGSSPKLRNEYIVFSAHMDHVGVGRPNAEGDSIYNGADDDASGTVAVIELAEAFAMLNPAPRRSLIFLTVSGEEKDLWGSDYFTGHPPVAIGQIVANLNIDMIGRNWRDTIVVIGKEHSDLGETLDRVNTRHPELDMTAIDDIWPEEGFYSRSDHFNFAQRGVPILFFFSGPHEDYHGVNDEVEKIDAEKESRIARLIFYLGLEIANTTERPTWNPESYEQIVEDQ